VISGGSGDRAAARRAGLAWPLERALADPDVVAGMHPSERLKLMDVLDDRIA